MQSDRLRSTGPARVAQLALVELAVVVTRQFVHVLDDLGQLVLRQPGGGERLDLARSVHRTARRPSAGWMTALIASPHCSSGTPNTAISATAGCITSSPSISAGIDVHPAGNDHVALAVTQVQVAVLVEVADVADREQVADARLARLLLALVIVEAGLAHPHVDQAGLAGRHLGAVLVQDLDAPSTATPCRPSRACSATRRSDRRAAALGRRVVLDDDRSPPLEHRPLDLVGHGAAPWIIARSDDTSYFARTSSGRASSRVNCVGTMWLCVTWYRSMRRSISSASKRSISTAVCPSWIEMPTKFSTAV